MTSLVERSSWKLCPLVLNGAPSPLLPFGFISSLQCALFYNLTVIPVYVALS